MARKLWETDADRDNEVSVIEALRQLWPPAAITPMPEKYPVDAHFDFGTHQAFVEIKCRPRPSASYSDYMIGMKKLIEGMSHARATGGSFLYVIRWEDCLCVCDLTEGAPGCRIAYQNRQGRSEREQQQPAVMIPADWFSVLDVANSPT